MDKWFLLSKTVLGLSIPQALVFTLVQLGLAQAGELDSIANGASAALAVIGRVISKGEQLYIIPQSLKGMLKK
jgi:hypothetical protein